MANTGNSILAFLSGAAIGAGIGILYAPEKGEDTRKRLGNEANRARGRLEKQWDETYDHLSSSAKKAKQDFDSKLEETLSSASYKADDIIASLEKRLEELREKNKKLQKDTKKKKPSKA